MIRVLPVRLSTRWTARRSARRAARAGDTAAPQAGYATFTAKSVASLTALGGAMTALGALGAWVRATRTVVEGFAPVEAEVVTGASDPRRLGWALGALGVATAVSALAWFTPSFVAKAAALIGSVGVIGIVVWHLDRLDATAAAMVSEAQTEPDFVAYHAGFGWGAWILVLGGIALALGVAMGCLRELDLRRDAR